MQGIVVKSVKISSIWEDLAIKRNISCITSNIVRRCGRSSCRLCPYTNIGQGTVVKSVKISSTWEDMAIKGNISCTTSNILRKCGRPSCRLCLYTNRGGPGHQEEHQLHHIQHP